MSGDQMPSGRALAIARGLVRSARASDGRPSDGYLHLPGLSGDDYWISFDGTRLLRGPQLRQAEELQQGFADSMARAGGGPS